MIDWNQVTQQVSDDTYAAWCAHDADAVAAVFAEDARTRDAGTDQWDVGRDAIRDRARLLMAGFSDFRLERQVLVVDGPRHADRWIMTGTHDGEFLGVEATGHTVEVEGGTFTLLDEGGLVAEDVHFVDYAALFRQLGIG